jgi:hypothetical protein
MNDNICDQPVHWQESVCDQIYWICEQRRKMTQQPAQQLEYDLRLIDIMQLCILPLADGTWTSASSEGDIFFDSETVGVPRELDLRLLSADIKPNTILREWDFLSDLGATHQVDVDFFLKRLVHLNAKGCDDEETIRSTYEQIQARFEENPKGTL